MKALKLSAVIFTALAALSACKTSVGGVKLLVKGTDFTSYKYQKPNPDGSSEQGIYTKK